MRRRTLDLFCMPAVCLCFGDLTTLCMKQQTVVLFVCVCGLIFGSLFSEWFGGTKTLRCEISSFCTLIHWEQFCVVLSACTRVPSAPSVVPFQGRAWTGRCSQLRCADADKIHTSNPHSLRKLLHKSGPSSVWSSLCSSAVPTTMSVAVT